MSIADPKSLLETMSRNTCSTNDQTSSHAPPTIQSTTRSQDVPANTLPSQESPEVLGGPSQGLVGSRIQWDTLRSLRKDALRLRSSLQKLRTILQIKEDSKEKADGAYLKYTRAHPPVNPTPTSEWNQDVLEKLYADLQHSRNDYGPVLVECMQKVEALDIIEFEIGRIENHLYVLLFGDIPDESTVTPKPSQENTNLESAFNPSPWLGLVAGVQDRFQPLQTKYLSRLGDLDLARERLGNLKQEQEDLLAEEESSRRVGRELSDNSKAALRDFPSREVELRHEIIEIQRDVENIKKECIGAGVDLDEASDEGSRPSLSIHGDDVLQDLEPFSGDNTGPLPNAFADADANA